MRIQRVSYNCDIPVECADLLSLADLRWALGTRPPPGSKFFHSHAVFGKILTI